MNYLLPFLLLFVCLACKNEEEPLFEDLPASETGLDFVNRSLEKPNFNIFNYRNFYNGAGVAIGDVNNDGFADVFLTSNFEENKLYLNKGPQDAATLKFEDVTRQAGIVGKKFWSTGVTMADVNGDGLLDIYVCNSGIRDARGNQLYINQGVKNGIPHFVEKAREYGLEDGGFSTHAAFFDYDRDGDLDMYLLNNSFTPMDRLQYANIRETRDKLGGDKLFRNDGSRFTDVSEQAGIFGSLIGFGLGITIGDVNNDNWPDIYISNDFYERDFLYINQKNGTFRESIKDYMNHISLTSMGADIADLNNDGNLDIFVTDMLPEDDYRLKTTGSFDSYEVYQLRVARDFHYQDPRNMLHLNNGDGTFSEIGRMAGVHATDWSWGALLFDMDMDGQKDIFVTNGILKDLTDQDFVSFLADNPDIQLMIEGLKKFDYKEYVNKMSSVPISNYAFKNSGDGLHYSNKAADWGLAKPGFSNGAAYGDLDNDGDLDLIVNNNNAPASVYRNRSVEKNKTGFLRVRLNGTPLNRSGIGTKVYVHQNGTFQYLQQMPNRGFQSSVDLTMVFGLGNRPVIDSLTVIWPGSGGEPDKKQVIRQPKANTTLTLDVRNASPAVVPAMAQPAAPRFFADVTAASRLAFTHTENNFVDYDRDGLLKQMLSREGPALAVGDVNGDGLEDIFFGGAVQMPRALFLQRPDGTFAAQQQPFLQDAIYTEDVAATFFDADNDNDLDLYVATGGNEIDDRQLQFDRFYRNDGRGRFTWDKTMTRVLANKSCVVAADFDRDGDQDLFVAGRMVSGQYGRPPEHALLVNNGNGTFRKGTDALMPFAKDLGMVTDAIWADVDNDRFPDLVLVGDWMPVTVLKNKGGKGFEKLTNETLAQSSGWWNTIRAADVDGDGDLDFIAGNLGLNSRLTASYEHPAHLYGNDFDKNGAYEQVMTCFRPRNGERVECLMAQKPDLQKRIPSIKTKFIKHTDYGQAGYEDVFTEEQRRGADVLTAYTGESALILNNGGKEFTLKPLPAPAQYSPVRAIQTGDYNRDGKLDLLLAGNFFDVLTEMGRYDASYGLLLTGNGKGEFTPVPAQKSGFFVRGQVRRMAEVRGPGGRKRLVLAKNNEAAQLLEVGSPVIQ